MCRIIDPGHTYDEYLVLLAKSGMTLSSEESRICLTNPKIIFNEKIPKPFIPCS
jgi:hypothetical protein